MLRAAPTGPEDSNPRNNLRLCGLQGECLLSLKVSACSAAQQSGNVTSAAAAADIPDAGYQSAVFLPAQRSFEQTQSFDRIDKINVWRLFVFNQGSIEGFLRKFKHEKTTIKGCFRFISHDQIILRQSDSIPALFQPF